MLILGILGIYNFRHLKTMLDEFKDVLEKIAPIPEVEGRDKVMPLKEAVKRFIRPQMNLHFAITHNRPCAAFYEIFRQYWGKQPNFTISALGAGLPVAFMAHAKMIKKVITTFLGDSYPTPGPNPLYHKAYLDGSIEFENWTILTYPLRLLAGAMGIEWIPTKSIRGSSMEQENSSTFRVIDNPSDTNDSLGLVRALRPDITLLHGWASDRAGNIILCPPYGDNLFGALASKEGVIATVEKVVSSDFIRRYAHLVKVPSYMVKSISQVPFGAHPSGLNGQGVREFESYADDYHFMEDMRSAAKDEARVDKWIREWILDCNDNEDYLARLGMERVLFLKGKADSDSWKPELRSFRTDISKGDDYNMIEMMIIAGARRLTHQIRRNKYNTVLAGVGASNLAAWLATYTLKEQDYEVELMAELGFYGYLPRPADPFIFNYRNIPTCKMLTDIFTIMGIFMGGSGSQNIGVIGAGQIDKYGNVNTTCIPGAMLLVGSGGANDIASAAKEVLVVAIQSKSRFVDKVPYITTPGMRIKTVVSNLGVFEKHHSGKELVLTGYFPQDKDTHKEVAVKRIRDQCGWDLKVKEDVQAYTPPSSQELQSLRIFDPNGQFLGK